MYNILNNNGDVLNDTPIKTKKLAREFLKEIYLNEHVPFFELGASGKLDGFPFKDFLQDHTIGKVVKNG